MAGGEGKRLRPFTNVIPKPLLPIGRRPIAQIIIERLRDSGFTEVIMAVGYGADLVRAYFGNGEQFGISISYFQERTRLGTAGPLAHVPQLGGAPFLVTNGDIVTDLDYSSMLEGHIDSKAAITVAAREESVTIPYGVLTVVDKQVTAVEEKPSLRYCFNAGVYALSPEVLSSIPGDNIPFDMTDLIQRTIDSRKQVNAHVFDGLWFDLAKVDDFDRAIAKLEADRPELFS